MKILIIGMGVVGRSTHNMLDGKHEVLIYDPPQGYKDIKSGIKTDACFVCVPIPTRESVQDLSYIKDVLSLLKSHKYKGLVIVKSTILPRNIHSLSLEYNNLDIMVSPEHLNQYQPYFEYKKHLIGVKNIYQAEKYRKIFGLEGYGHADVRTTSIATACMAKWTHNCFGALKVIFFNEIFDACKNEDINYRELIECMLATTNHISECYTKMSADGERGFAGSCFPDNTSAFSNEYNVKTLEAAVEKNKEYRPLEMVAVL